MIDWTQRTISNYRVESVLGNGGMGRVYRGTHLHLRRDVAIEVLHDQFADAPTFRARFQEARAAAALDHPHVVQVFDFGERDGSLCLVMELVPDGSLCALLQRLAAAVATRHRPDAPGSQGAAQQQRPRWLPRLVAGWRRHRFRSWLRHER
jgi:hypothetical protein